MIKELTDQQLNKLALWMYNKESKGEMIAAITDEFVLRIEAINKTNSEKEAIIKERDTEIKEKEIKISKGRFKCKECGKYNCISSQNICGACLEIYHFNLKLC